MFEDLVSEQPANHLGSQCRLASYLTEICEAVRSGQKQFNPPLPPNSILATNSPNPYL